MKFPQLKRGVYTSPQSGSIEHERYVIENMQDLNKFAEVFFDKSVFIGLIGQVLSGWEESLKSGQIIIVTDGHSKTGLPTYCFEEQDKTNTHPSSFHRVRLI